MATLIAARKRRAGWRFRNARRPESRCVDMIPGCRRGLHVRVDEGQGTIPRGPYH